MNAMCLHREMISDDTSLGLYHLPDNISTPFVVWYVIHEDDGTEHRYWGSYCYNVLHAANKYRERAAMYIPEVNAT